MEKQMLKVLFNEQLLLFENQMNRKQTEEKRRR
jgi:hypothetical protein